MPSTMPLPFFFLAPALSMRLPRSGPRATLTTLAAAALLAISGCAVGPDYVRPAAATSAGFKEAPLAEAGWLPAAPADNLARGPWWELFGDADLDRLVEQVAISNQNIAASVAAYAQARALVGQQQAALYPQLNLAASGQRRGSTGGSSSSNGFGGVFNTFQSAADASWALDLWGGLRRNVESASASAQVSDADLAAATLSAQGEVANNYFSLRDADTQIGLLERTVEAYRRAVTITRNRYDAGIAPRTDLLQAQTQLSSTLADLSAQTNQRAVLEHAIAVLVGQAPADFSVVPAASWQPVVPPIALVVPSALLQRRPDIAAAERAVAAANALIGVARAAYFPAINLSASAGNAASAVNNLFKASQMVWSIGLSAAQVVFDGGAIASRIRQAEANRDVTTARYRQTVLVAFQSVEDQLSSLRTLSDQAGLRRDASAAADLTEQQLLNRYQAGQVSYTDVVTAQASALTARRAVSQVAASRQSAAVGLIQALGGGWNEAQHFDPGGEMLNNRPGRD